MAFKIRNLILCLGIVFSAQRMRAQEPPPLRELNFHVLSGSRIHNVRYGVYDDNGNLIGSKQTGFRSSGRSLKYAYKGPAKIIFFEETPAPTPSNPKTVSRKIVGVSNVPSGVTDVLFLFTLNKPAPEQGYKYNIQWIDTSDANFPPGHVTIYNTLPLEFKGVLGKKGEKGKVIEVSPGMNPPFSFHPEVKIILTLKSENDGILRVYEDNIIGRKDDRILLVLFPPRFPGSINIGSKIITFPLTPVEKEKTNPASSSTN
ncbi:hypothetical protein P0Y35_14165 [Kiritimatiellaeota bacterium B1221]|nr:hypothetical protein [Kiritimatiellaeota bacterium B1221]